MNLLHTDLKMKVKEWGCDKCIRFSILGGGGRGQKARQFWPRTQKCNSDISKYCNMLTKNVASVVGQKCDPMFFWLWMAHPSMLAWIKNLIPSSSAWGHKKYGSEIVSLATSVSLFFWLWISHPSDLEPQKADFPSLGPSSQKNAGIAQCCDVWPNFYVANHPLSLPTCVTKSVSIFSSCSCVMQRRAEFLKLQCW